MLRNIEKPQLKEDVKTKKCSKCKEEKELKHFARLTESKSGYRPKCKSCSKQYKKERGLHIPQDSEKYVVDKYTMRNHMFMHFGFWESKITQMERDHNNKDLRKYYRTEQKDTL